jgi:hypothetical protein
MKGLFLNFHLFVNSFFEVQESDCIQSHTAKSLPQLERGELEVSNLLRQGKIGSSVGIDFFSTHF